ncbi:MAG: DUF4249 family protein [Flavobacteriales bacterium]|nr:DUF4249 family protein [Flavobacteriales bacterium]
MKRLKSLAILSAFTGVIFFSCIPKPLDIEIASAETKLVVSSQVIPNATMIVTLSKSFGALSFNEDNGDTTGQELLDQLLVDSAIITISYTGFVDTLYPIPGAPGLYASIGTPTILNADYTLNIYDPGLDQTIWSTAKMLEQVQFDSVSAILDTTGTFSYTDVTYSFQDLLGDNYYMVNFYSESNDSVQSGSPFSAGQNIPTETLLLNDQLFSGSYSDTHRLWNWEEDTLFVSISNISQEYYEYLELRQKSGNFFTDLVKEPINYPSNIEGGYGYFTTHFPDVKLVTIP